MKVPFKPTYTGLKIEFIVLTKESRVDPLTVVVVPTHETVDFSGPVPIVETPTTLMTVPVRPEATRQFTDLENR